MGVLATAMVRDSMAALPRLIPRWQRRCFRRTRNLMHSIATSFRDL
jgi:hypothetical protein